MGQVKTLRLTTAQALVRWLAAQRVETPAGVEPLFGGVWAIFGHGNVSGIGEALYAAREDIPTLRAHNEQSMAHAAIAYAKANFRRRMMAVTTSIGPGATNLVTAAAVAHVNRLPLLLLPGDIFVSRAPDPVLQQLEDFHDGGASVNDCFKPVSRYFDRIVRPEQLLSALPRALAVLTDAALCGPVTIALPQDVQTEAFDWPEDFFAQHVARFRAPPVDAIDLEQLADRVRRAKRPLIVAGGGVLYSDGGPAALRAFAEAHGVPVGETQAGKSALPWDHPLQAGSIGVTGAEAANVLAREADLVLAVGTRLQDFTTGSNALFAQAELVAINPNVFDAIKWRGKALQSDAALGLKALSRALEGWRSDAHWRERANTLADDWRSAVSTIVASSRALLPTYAEVIGVVQSDEQSAANDVVVCAGGTLPGELHKLWRSSTPGGYHLEYGYSCMGYEIAGGLGVKFARPGSEVVVMVGDGSYLMANSEIATSVMLGRKIIVLVLDNQGYACINRLQQACGGAPFNNLWEDCLQGPDGAPAIDFAGHARALGAEAEEVSDIATFGAAMKRARASRKTYVISIEVDKHQATDEGGCWWDVAVPEVSTREQVKLAREAYERARVAQRK